MVIGLSPAVRALLLTGFLAMVSLGLLGVLALPSVGTALGPLVCEAGEKMIAHESTWSRPGETVTSVEYACAGPAGERALSFFVVIKAALMVYFGFFAFVVFPFVFFRFQRSAARAQEGPRFDAASANDLAALARKLAQDHAPPQSTTFTMPSDTAPGDVAAIEALRTLSRMRTEGFVTAEEYEAKKAEILSRL